MAYLYNNIATTTKGKIIYRRETHGMTICDVRRMVAKLEIDDSRREMQCYISALQEMLTRIAEVEAYDLPETVAKLRSSLVNMAADVEGWEEFGGGEFGGGGASREIPVPGEWFAGFRNPLVP